MKIILASLAVAGLALGVPAVSAQQTGSLDQDTSFAGIDADRDGLVSWPEFSLVYTNYSQTQFDEADANRDGYLSDTEFADLVVATGSIGVAPMAPQPAQPFVAPEDEGRSLTYSKEGS